ncbi:hypothetical protein AB4Y45_33715 [Paraburkholderia sp. EG287A]|uniref:hypothetical protein n=1 Tax=Paraburkholderia sp. EG287A TaxID=3237012 RepID=UPI0034D2665E
MSECNEEKRILVVGGDGPMTATIVKELIRRGYNAREATEEEVAAAELNNPMRPVSFELHGHLADEPVVPTLVTQYDDCGPRHGWYQQFAGRRGRPPRY